MKYMKVSHVSTQKADIAFEIFYLDFKSSFPNVAKYVTRDILQIAWNSGVIWAIDETMKDLDEVINP